MDLSSSVTPNLNDTGVLVSVLLPTRNRHEMCRKSINSLFKSARIPSCIEILIAYDSDDLESSNILKETYKDTENIHIFEYPRYGYKHLHKYVNDLSTKATGKWLVLWNDDALMETVHWDDILRSYGDKFCCICPYSNIGGCGLFPFIPKKWVEITGHFSLNCHLDTWVEDVSAMINLRINDNRIRIMHDRGDLTGNNKDSTYYEREYDTEYYYSSEPAQQRANDARLILDYMNKLM